MSDNIPRPSLSRKAGRGFLRALRGLFGGRALRRAADSWQALRDEFAAGRDEARDGEPPPRSIPHRELPGPGSTSGGAPREPPRAP